MRRCDAPPRSLHLAETPTEIYERAEPADTDNISS